MDLGLSELTDDQLLDLLDQACAELAQRDGYVRQLAQQTIVRGAQKRDAIAEALEPVVRRVKQNYIDQLKRDAAEELEAAMREGLQSGSIRLDISEETAAVIEAVREGQARFSREELRDPRERAGAQRRAEEAAERYKRMTGLYIERDTA